MNIRRIARWMVVVSLAIWCSVAVAAGQAQSGAEAKAGPSRVNKDAGATNTTQVANGVPGQALRSSGQAGATDTSRGTNATRITKYTLPPQREREARTLAKVRLRSRLVELVYGFAVLLVVLWWKLAAKYRDVAEKASGKRFVQVLIFAPLIALTMDVMQLPTGIYDNWLDRAYGLSVQGWASWFWDWTKGELLSVIGTIIVVWILYAVIRKSPGRWWFYFWLATLPLILALIFIQPLVIDPMFHKFEPLQVKDPGLTVELEKMVQRAGENIPPERMYWMGAGEKTTKLNAYVTGFGASKRIVVWDTTIAKMNTPQIVFVAGHEMGHYVLKHIPKGIAFAFAGLFVTFYLGYRLIRWVLARWGWRGGYAGGRLGVVSRATAGGPDFIVCRAPIGSTFSPISGAPGGSVWIGSDARIDAGFGAGGGAVVQHFGGCGSVRSGAETVGGGYVLRSSGDAGSDSVLFAL